LAKQLLPFAGDSRAFSSIVAVFSDTNTCLAIYLVGKLVGDFSMSKLTGSPKKYKQHPLTMLQVYERDKENIISKYNEHRHLPSRKIS
jgi:hypothetical protein